MKILFMGNNWVGLKILEWLKNEGEDIVGLVVHPPENQKYTQNMLQIAGLPSNRIFSGSQLHSQDLVKELLSLSPDIGLSVFFNYVIPPEIFQHIPKGIINLHPALLPYNRGQYPNVWSIVENTPSGVTIHYIDEKIDSGDIISQQSVDVEPVDTGETIYRKLENASLDLFCKTWPNIKSGIAQRRPQKFSSGSYHRTADVEKIDRIDLDKQYSARYLIDIMRARTFPPYRGTFFEVNGKRIYLKLLLEYEKDD